MLIFGGAADAIIFGGLVFATAPFDWQGATGLVVAIGGVTTSIYGLYVQDRRTNSRVAELEKEAADAKRLVIEAKAEAQKEIDRLTAELARLNETIHANSSAIREIKNEQAVAKLSGSNIEPSPNKTPVVAEPEETR